MIVANSRKWLYNKFIALILVGVAFVLPFLCNGGMLVSAANPSMTFTTNTSYGKVLAAAGTINSDVKSKYGFTFLLLDASHNKVSIDISSYNALSANDKKDCMTSVLKAINSCGLPSNVRLRLYNFVADQDQSTAAAVRNLSNDVNADFATAYSWFKPFSGTVSTILGLLCILITVFLGLMIVIDVAYLSLPPFKAALDKTNGEKPKFVSNEAYKACLEAEKGESKAPVIGIYLKLKSVQIILVSICLLYLVSGKIYSLVAWIIDSFSGVVG